MTRPSPLQLVSDEKALAGAAIALGAERVGPISDAEKALAAAAGKVGAEAAGVLRAAILDGFDPLGDAFCRIRSPTQAY